MLIFENDHVKLFHTQGDAPFAVGSFAHLGYPPQQPAYWGQSRFQKLSIEGIGFVAKTNNWFPAEAMQEIVPVVARLISKPLVLYGHSMGAYAAVKYSALFGATGVIASCVMTSIDPADVPEDRRYHHYFDSSLNAAMEIAPADLGGGITLIYDRFERLDRFHAERLLASAPDATIRQIHTDFYGHEAVQVMIDRFVFASIIGQTFHGLPMPELADHVRRSKKTNPKYLINLARHVANRGGTPLRRERTLRFVLDRIRAMPTAQVEWFVQVQAAHMLARVEAACGHLGAAIDLMKHALSLEQRVTGVQTPNRVLELAGLWSAFGCPSQSIELLTRLVGDGQCQPEAERMLRAQQSAANVATP